MLGATAFFSTFMLGAIAVGLPLACFLSQAGAHCRPQTDSAILFVDNCVPSALAQCITTARMHEYSTSSIFIRSLGCRFIDRWMHSEARIWPRASLHSRNIDLGFEGITFSGQAMRGARQATTRGDLGSHYHAMLTSYSPYNLDFGTCASLRIWTFACFRYAAPCQLGMQHHVRNQ